MRYQIQINVNSCNNCPLCSMYDSWFKCELRNRSHNLKYKNNHIKKATEILEKHKESFTKENLEFVVKLKTVIGLIGPLCNVVKIEENE